MSGVTTTHAALSEAIISLLESSALDPENWQARVSELEQEHGVEVFRHLFFILTQLDFTGPQARRHWRQVLAHWRELNRLLGETADLHVVVLHYFLKVQRKLKNPAMVELKILQQTRDSAIQDELTGVYNYRYFQDRIDHEVKRARRYRAGLALLMLDLDDFKQYNDLHGHLRGNAVLKRMAGIFRDCVREVDVVTRYGGEEFAVLLPATRKDGALKVAEKIRRDVEAAAVTSMPGKCITVSIGIATAPADATTADQLVEKADSALYRAKGLGKNRVQAFSDDRREFIRYRAELTGRLQVMDQKTVDITTSNVSEGGLLFFHDEPLNPGSIIQMQIRLPDGPEPVSCTARVARVIEREEDYEIGVRIIHFDANEAYRYRKYIAELSAARPPIADA